MWWVWKSFVEGFDRVLDSPVRHIHQLVNDLFSVLFKVPIVVLILGFQRGEIDYLFLEAAPVIFRKLVTLLRLIDKAAE
jgi:hypothetical protein